MTAPEAVSLPSASRGYEAGVPIQSQGQGGPVRASSSSNSDGVKRVRFDEQSQNAAGSEDAVEDDTGIPLAVEEYGDENVAEEEMRPGKRPAEDTLEVEEEEVLRGKKQRLAMIAEKQPTMLSMCSEKNQSKLRKLVKDIENGLPRIKAPGGGNHRQRRIQVQEDKKSRPAVAEI